MNNRERELWIMNDEGLYNWFKSSRLSLHNFIKEFRNQIDGIIEKNAPKKTDTIDHGTYTFTIYQESKNKWYANAETSGGFFMYKWTTGRSKGHVLDTINAFIY